jgi:maleylacetoacetate isomerase
LSQSLAIIDYIDRRWPKPSLYPEEPHLRAKALSFALHIAAEISPLNNTRVLRHLSALDMEEGAIRKNWYRHWIAEGFRALETMLEGQSGPYCFGAHPTIADICLVPQLFNARRHECGLAPYPRLVRAGDHAKESEAFARAAPELQPDAV